MDTGLANQVVLITGASGGIGLATAQAFADEGASLILQYHRHAEPLAKLHRTLIVQNALVQADLRSEPSAEAMFTEALKRFEQIDAVVVNAGFWNPRPAPLHMMTLEHWRRTLEVDLTSAFLTCRAFMRHLAAKPREHASIVLIGSTAALFGEADHADYAAAKAGIVYGLTPTLKNEIVKLAPRGRVNCVCPGWTDTPMATPYLSDENALRKTTATMPLKKIATPEDIARTIVHLTSPTTAAHITGAVIPIAGGMEGRLLE
jgi:3-oxoacyl-[acyl-carrier protein] reductase